MVDVVGLSDQAGTLATFLAAFLATFLATFLAALSAAFSAACRAAGRRTKAAVSNCGRGGPSPDADEVAAPEPEVEEGMSRLADSICTVKPAGSAVVTRPPMRTPAAALASAALPAPPAVPPPAVPPPESAPPEPAPPESAPPESASPASLPPAVSPAAVEVSDRLDSWRVTQGIPTIARPPHSERTTRTATVRTSAPPSNGRDVNDPPARTGADGPYATTENARRLRWPTMLGRLTPSLVRRRTVPRAGT